MLDSIYIEELKFLDQSRSLLKVEPVFVLSKIVLQDLSLGHSEDNHQE
jgi:hypothetical protein